MLLYADWGEKFWKVGIKNFYTYPDWYYAPPNYPPIISLIYGAAYWLYDHKYYIAELHNLIKIPPAIFIVYFYDYGYYLLLKLPAIVADLTISVIIYGSVFNLTKSVKKAGVAMLFYLFNPVSVFLSGVWGQTDSLVSLLALGAFMLLIKDRSELSIPLYFASLYTKPNWLFFAPLYLYLLIKMKPGLRKLLIGITGTLIIFIITTYPFAGANFFPFSSWLLTERILPTATVAEKLSVSAFNFYTIFFTIDKDPVSRTLMGMKLGILGWIVFLGINLAVIININKRKLNLKTLMWSLFTIGFGGFLFLPNMLERYFFPSFIPMIILMFSNLKLLIYGLVINTVVFMNLVWAFFRRSNDSLGKLFTDDNFLIMRILSSMSLLAWLSLAVKEKIMLQSNRG